MSYLDRIGLAVEQHCMGVTGDQTEFYGFERTANTFQEMGGVYSRWWDSTKQALDNPLLKDEAGESKPLSSLSRAQQTAVVLRSASNVVNAVMGALSSVQDAMNVGFANFTAPLAAIAPSLPASTMTSMYVGAPHGHPHPPSYVPAPPTPGAVIPLPSLGNVLIGNHLKTLIGSLPAARAGDIGLAPTCCGFTPFFEIKTGSSNVFIGGKRAARMLDLCWCCQPGGGAMQMVDKVMAVAGVVAGGLAIAADIAEVAVEDNAAIAAGKALSAAMNSAQMAADAAAMAAQAAMGKDPAVIPGPGPVGVGPMLVTGALVIGNPLVLIGGFPMPNFPDPVTALLKKLAALRSKSSSHGNEEGKASTGQCR